MASNHSSCKEIEKIMNIVKFRYCEKATKFKQSPTFFELKIKWVIFLKFYNLLRIPEV